MSFLAATFQGLPPVFTNPDGYQRFSGFTSTNGVFVASSSDGGLTWADPVPVAMNTYTPDGPEVPFEAWPSMAVDNSPTRPDGTANPNFGSAYVAWSRFYPPGQFPGQPTSTSGSDVLVAVSRDGGQTWTTLTQTDPDTGLLRSVILDPRYKDNGTGGRGRGFVTFPTVTVGAGGDVFVSTYAGGDFTVYHSSNGGLSFTPPDYDAQTGLPFPTLNGIIVPSPSLPVNEFLGAPEPRTLPLRQNVADPSHPGRVYAVAAVNVTARVGLQAGSVVDRGDVILARSDDFGQTWSSDFTILKQPPVADRLTPAQAASFLPTLNDDNGGDQEALALSLSTQVLADQALPSIAVDGKGNVVVVWYDTRVSPLVPNDFGIVNALSVWGTVSTDGGHTFSPNFQISDTPFDPVNGQFVAGNGSLATYLGDQIGVVIADGTAFVAWADARHGRDLSNGQPFRQDVYLGSFKLSPNPSAPVDRFGGTNTFETPIDLTAPGFAANSPIDLARVVLAPGRADKWFVMQTGTSGPLIASVRGARPGDLQLEITDETGTVLLATASPVTDSDGSVLGTQLTLAATAGASYYVHVFGTNDGALSFDLSLTNLTADLGQQVQGSVTASGVQDLYRLAAGVTGTLNLSLSDPGHGLIVLNPDGFTALFDGTITGEAQVALPVSADQVVLLLVVDLTGEGGSYTLNYENEDQYSDSHTVFLTTLRDPSSVVTADFNGDGNPDLLTTSTDRTDAVGVYLGNGNGTFQAAAQYTVGAGPRGRLADNRQPAIFDVNNDGIPDAVIPNFRASDVSVLLGRGDGTFLPQRRAEVAPNPDFTAAGDFNRDGNPDVVTLQAGPLPGQTSELSVLLGRGTGEFAVAGNYPTAFTDGVGPVLAGDFTGDSVPDLLVFSQKLPLGQLFVGNGDGTFTDFGTFSVPESVLSVQALDLDGDGKLALILGGTNSGSVYMMLGNGDGTFQPAVAYIVMLAGQGDGVEVRSFAVIDFDPTSTPLPLPAPAGSPSPETQLVYGTRALVLTAQPRSGQGQAQVILLPELLHLDGQFAGFNSPVTVAEVRTAGNLTTGDFDGDGKTDVAVTDAGGVTVVYGISAPPPAVPANDSPATALNLSAATHYVSPVLSIVPSRESASFQFTVPTESTSESGPQVIDISTLARNETGPGLRMEVLDAAGDVLASGLRVRVVAQQGEVLTVRVFAGTDGTIRGYGAYTLSIDVLPQVVTAQAQSFVPGDPPASIVLTLQGDRLDPTTAEDPANYTVTWFGPDGQTRVIPVGAAGGAQSVVYNPGANVEASNGVTFPAVVRQTVTLLFEQSLPAGAYTVSLSPRIQTAAFEAGEGDQLAGGPELAGHPVVSVAGGGTVQNGATVVVAAPPSGVDPDDAESPFLTQLQNDLGAILDALLRAKGDDTSITATVMSQIVARMLPGLDPDTPFLILWLDPVSLAVADSAGGRTEYKKGSGRVDQGLQNTFVEVGGNVELLVVRGARGVFDLEVADAGAVARGGAAVISGGTARTVDLTPAIRSGQGKFEFTIDGPGVGPTPPERGDGAAANPSPVPLSAPPVLGGATGSGAGAASSGTGSTGAISPGTVPAAGVLTGSVPLLGPATGSPAGGSPAPAAPAPIGPTAIEANGRAGSVSGPAANSTTDTISGTGSVSLTHEAVVRFTAALREALIRAMTRGTLFRLAMQQFIDSVGDEGRATFECRDSAPAPASGQSRSDPLEQGTNTLTRGLADGPRTAAAEPTVTDSPEPGQAGAAASDPGQRRLAGVGSVAVLASLLWVYLAERRGQTAKSGKRLDDLPPRV